MKSNRPYSIALPLLLVLGMLGLWVAASVDARSSNPVSFSCEEIEECFEEPLEEDARENPWAALQSSTIPEVGKRCLVRVFGTSGTPNTAGPSGWLMPLRI